MFKGVGNPKFVVKLKSDGSTVETIEIPALSVIARQDLSYTARQDIEEQNPLTQDIVDEPLGWYYKETIGVATQDAGSSFSVYIAKQKIVSTESAVTKCVRLEEYSDELDASGDDKYEIYFWPHADQETYSLLDDPYLVKIDIDSLSAANLISDSITMTVHGLEAITQYWSNFETVPGAFTGAYSNGYSSGYDI